MKKELSIKTKINSLSKILWNPDAYEVSLQGLKAVVFTRIVRIIGSPPSKDVNQEPSKKQI